VFNMGILLLPIYHYAGQWFQEQTDGQVTEISKDLAEAALAEGAPLIEGVGEVIEGIGEDIGQAVGELGDITLSVIKGSGIALVEGMSDTYGYVTNQVKPYRVEAVAVLWSMVIYGLTISTIIKRIKNV
jgi:hypothetical protein